MNKVHRSVWNEITRTFVAVAEVVRSNRKSSKQAEVLSASQINPILLEQRFMFDGALVSALVDPNLQTATDVHVDTAQSDLSKAIAVAEVAAQPPQVVRTVDSALNNGRKEVAFVDTGVADYQTLVDGIRAGVEVVLLDAGQDGLAQMALWAQSHSGYDAIHVLSHGTQGSIFLGNTELNQTLLSTGQVERELSSIGTALNVGGDILLYGCDVAQYSAGQTFIKALAQLTNSDVAASTDATGSSSLGGDWILEYSTGNVEASSIMVERYQSLLSTPTNGNTDFVAYAGASGNYNQLATGTNNVNFLGKSDLLGWNISAHIPSTPTYLQNASDGLMASEDTNSGTYTSPYIYFFSNGGATKYDYMSFKSNDGKIFDFRNINIDFYDSAINTENITVAGYLGGTLVANAQISLQITFDGDPASGFTLFNATANSAVENAFKGVDEIRVIAGTPSASVAIDEWIFASINAVNFRTPSVADTTPPNAPSTPDLTVATDTGTSSTDNITNNTTPVFTGTAEAGSTVTLYDTDGTTVLGTATATGGNWSITTTSALSSGTHTITAKATDAAGNTSTASTSLSVTVDTTAPTAPSAPDMTSASDSGTQSTDNITSNNTPVFTGTAEANSTVKLYDTNGTTLLGTATADGSGNWSITSSTLSEGSHTLTVKATDTAGNTSVASSSLAVTIDRTAPITTIASKSFSADTGSSNSDFITKTAAQTISGTLSANVASGEIVYVSLDNGATWTAATTSVGVSTWSLSGQTLSASNTLKIKVTDAAGNDGTVSSQAYTLDTSAPSAPSTPDMTSASDTGSSNTDNITSNTTPTFTGTAEAGSTVTLYDTDGTTVLGTATATGGNWSITSSALSSGNHTITAKVTDAAGNVSSASAGLTTTVDAVAPSAVALSTTSLAETLATSGSTLATLSATDNSSLTYSLVAGAGDTNNGSFTITGTDLKAGSSNLAAGTYDIRVRATDAAGNFTDQTFTVTVASGPSVASINRAGASALTNASSVAYTVTYSELVTGVDASDFVLTATGTAGGTIASISGSGTTYTVTVNSLSGEGTLRLDLNNSGTGIVNGGAQAITGGFTSGQTYTLDTTAPTAPSGLDMTAGSDSGSSNTDNITSVTTPTINGGGAEAGATVKLYDTDGTTLLGTTTADGSGNWSITTSALTDGAHTLKAKVTDAAGNTGAASTGLTLTIDTTAPSAPSAPDLSTASDSGSSSTDNITSVTTPTLTGGGVEAGATVTLYDTNGTTVLGTSTADGSGNWSITSSTLTSGAHTLTTKVTDSAGNTGAASTGLTVTIDTTAPSAPSAPDLASGSDAGTSNTDNITSVTTPTLTGSGAEAGATVKLYDTDGTTLLGTATADGSGNWSITSSTLTNGAHTLTTKVTDAAGNTSAASAGLTVTVDTAGPSETISSATLSSDTGTSSTDFITNTATQTISGSLSTSIASGETVYVSLDNGNTWAAATVTVGQNSWSLAGQTLTGSGTLKVKVTDVAGNDGSVFSQSYSLDTVAPTAIALNHTSVTEADTGTSSTIASLSSTDLNAVTYALVAGNGTNDADNSSFSITGTSLKTNTNLAAGTYNIQVAATDAAGNVTYQSLTITVTNQQVTPTPTLTPPLPQQPPVVVPTPQIKVVAAPEVMASAPVSSFFNQSNTGEKTAITIDSLINSLTPVVNDKVVETASRAVSIGVRSGSGEVFVSGLSAINKLAEMEIPQGEASTISLPAGTFVHTDATARVSLSARLTDGKPLPSYVKFNPTTGTFTVEASNRPPVDLQIRVIAVDDKGKTANTTVVIKIKGKSNSTSSIDVLPISGKMAFTEQLRNSEKPSGLMSHLAALNKAFEASNASRSHS